MVSSSNGSLLSEHEMEIVHSLSLQLLEGVSSYNSEKFDVESRGGYELALSNYLLNGKGCKILKLLHDITNKGDLPCPSELVHLCASLLLVLTSFQPTDFKSGQHASLKKDLHSNHGQADLIDVWLLENFKTRNVDKCKTDWVKLRNSLLVKRTIKFRKGAKLSSRRLSNRICALTRKNSYTCDTATQSSDEEIHNTRAEYELLTKLGKTRSLAAKGRTGKYPFLKPRLKMNTELIDNYTPVNCSSTTNVNGETPDQEQGKVEEQLKKYDNVAAFEGPFELASVLLDLLESSFCSKYANPVISKEPSSPTDGDSPMSMAIQLVTAITALQQTKVAFVRSNSVDNNRLMSQISFEDTRWTSESLSHLQRLVLRTVIVLCQVGIEHGEDIHELVQCQAIESLLRVSSDILSRGGMIPHGSSPRASMHSRLKKVDSFGNKLSDLDKCEDKKPSLKKESVPLNGKDVETSSCDQNEKVTSKEKFESKYCKLKKQSFIDCTADVPPCLMFVSDVLTGLFVVLTRALQSSPGTTNPKQLSEVCSLMHEFNNCRGFLVFSALLQQVSALCDDINLSSETVQSNGVGPLLSPLKSPSYIRIKSQTSPSKETNQKPVKSDNAPYHLFIKLLAVHEEVVTTIQRAKVEYMHKVSCSRRNHRLCVLSRLVPVHHNLLGMEARYSVINKPLDDSDIRDANRSFLKKSPSNCKSSFKTRRESNTPTSEENCVCAVATGVKFLVDLVVVLKARSNFLREVLRTLDRVGICQCLALSSIVTPLLCNISSWSDKTQNIALAIVGKMILHHYSEDEISMERNESSLSTSMHLLFPAHWTKQSLLKASAKKQLFQSTSPNNSWRHSLPVNMKMPESPSTPKPSLREAVEGMMFQHNANFPRLSLSLYQPLLYENNGDLALKVALHLQSVSQHLCNAAKSALMTLVFIPVLCEYAGVAWEAAMETICDEKGEFSEDVVFIVFGIILQFLEESSNCQVLFVRHGGMKALNEIFNKTFFENDSANPPSGGVITLVLDMFRVISMTPLSLSNHASVALFKANQNRYYMKQHSLDVAGTSTDVGGVRSFFRGISLSWGNDKRRSKDPSDPTLVNDAGGNSRAVLTSKPPRSNEDQTVTTMNVNESSAYFYELKKFIRMAMDITGATSYDRSKEMMRKAKNFVRGVSGAESTDSENNDLRSSLKKRKRKMSETSGYRSTSPEQSVTHEQTSNASQSGTSALSYVADSIILPGEGDFDQWKDISDLWNILGLALPQEGQLCTIFIELNGFEVALKLLNLISMGLSSYFEAELDFTQTTNDQTTSESLVQSPSLSSSVEILSDKGLKKAESSDSLSAKTNSIPRIKVTRPENVLKKTASLDNILSETFRIGLFKSFTPTTSTANASNTSVVDNEVKQNVLEQKLNLLCSCLRICLFCAKLRDQFDLDVTDVISMLKPALVGKISSLNFSKMLHSSLIKAAIKPVSKDVERFIRLKTVLHGLQRVINSGGSTHRMHMRNSSLNLTRNLTPVNQPDGRNQFLGNHLSKSDFEFFTPTSQNTLGTGSQHVTRDDEEETLSDGLSSDGYEGDSDTDSHISTAMSSGNLLTPCKSLDSPDKCEETLQSSLNFTNGPLVHPELILLSIELLGARKTDDAGSNEHMNDEGTDMSAGSPLSEHTLTTREEVALALLLSLIQVASYSKENLRRMAKKNDVASTCLSQFADFLQTDRENWKSHRQSLLSLCMMLNKHHMTSNHLCLVLSKFHSKSPPLLDLLNYLLELVESQQFGPNWFLQFSWLKSAIDDDSSEVESDDDNEAPPVKHADVSHTRTLSVWEVAPLHMPLENRVTWPPMDSGITIAMWLKVAAGEADIHKQANIVEGHVIMVESDSKVDSSQSCPYIHLLSLGSKHTMLQVWLENTTLIFRICVDPNDSKPVGLLAQSQCSSFLSTNEWQHLTLTYTENRMPDKAILGKVHLVLNCFIENDVILEFNVPQTVTKSGLSSWRQSSPSSTLNLQKANLFLGHCDSCTAAASPFSLPATSPSTVAIGNIMLFNQPHPTCQSAFVLERLGPNATCLTECLSDARDKGDVMKDCRVRFGVDPLISSTHEWSELRPSSRLFRLLPQALSNDSIPEDILTGESQPDTKSLQESLVMSFNAAEPSIFHVYIPNPNATPTRRRMLFRRAVTDPAVPATDFDPLTQTGHRMKVLNPHKDSVRSVPCSGLNRSLNHVGGALVFLLLYPKIVEITSTLREVTSSLIEGYQVLALKSLLKLRASSTERKKEFLSNGVACMLRKVMIKQESIIGFPTLQVLFNTACSDDVIKSYTTDSGHVVFQVNNESNAIIHDFEILQAFLLDWKVWHKARNADGEADFGVWTLLLQGFVSLTRDDHPHQWFNSKMLLRAGIVEKMLEGIQEMVSEGISPLPGPEVTSMMVEVIRGIMGSPPDVAIMKILCDFLIAIHPPAGTFVCHSVTSFYFSLNTSDFFATASKTWKSMNSLVQDGSEASHSTPAASTPCPFSPSPTSENRPPLNRTMSAPMDGPLKSPISPLPAATKDKSDDVKNDEEVIENSSPKKNENESVDGQTSRRSGSKLHQLTPIKEDDHQSSPRPTSLDVPGVKETSHLVEEEARMEVTAEGGVTMKFDEKCSDSTDSLSTPLQDSWENVPHIPQTEDEESEGISLLVTETLNIMFVAVMTMRDVDVPHVFGESLNPHMLVVLAHHGSSSVQTAVIRLLAVYFSRCPPEEQVHFLKKKGFHLLANQLHQHVTTLSIVEACLYFLLGQPVVVDEPLPLDGAGHSALPIAHDAFTNHAAITLLAVMEKSFWNGPDLCLNLLARLNELFEYVGPIADIMLDNGLTLALCNLLNAISGDPIKCLDHNERQPLYDGVEDFMGSIAIKSCVTSGSGHFQVFEDLMILLYTVEKRAEKTYGGESCQVKSIKTVTHNILLRVMDAMKISAGGKPCTLTRSRRSSLDGEASSPLASISGSLSGSELTKISDSSITSSFLPAPSSPAFSDASSTGRNNVFFASGMKSNNHKRAHSMGTALDAFYVPSPTLTRGRALLNSTSQSSPYSSVNGDARSGAFRSRSSALRSRSFRGNQRRRINETETAHRLQRVIIISVDRIIFTEGQNNDELCASKTKTFAPLPSPQPSESSTHKAYNSFVPEVAPQNFDCERTFPQVTFDIFVEWLFSLMESTEANRKRSSTTQSSAFSWERILHLAHSVLVEQTSRLFVYFLSPWQVSLRKRTYPLHIMNQNRIEVLINTLLPPTSNEGQKVAVYLHYLLYYYKHQLSKQEKHDGKKLSKIVSRIGHRVSSQHRRAIHEASSENEPACPGPLDEFQEKFDRERRKCRAEWSKYNVSQYQLLVTRTSRLAEHVSRHAMEMTQQVVLQQNNERKKMHGRMKERIANDLNVRKNWTRLLEQLAHERAVWYNPEEYPKSWQLDPTEGPFRERRRLQRCHIGIDSRFLLNNAAAESNCRGKGGIPVSMEPTEEGDAPPLTAYCVSHKRPLAFLFEDDSHSSDSVTIRTRLQTNERIRMVQNCTNVTAACETNGEILIGENNIYFVADEAIVDPSLTQAIFGEREILSLSWHHRDVEEYHKRWWQLRDIAIEIFLVNGKTYFLAFKNIFERDMIYDELSKLELPNLLQTDDFQSLTKAWCSGRMTNFDYLTRLNKTAGRSFNDLMQYPVLPFVLSDYSSQILDLESASSFRLLDKPISVQDSSREQHFQERYKFLEDDYKNCTEDERELKTPPFHYGSHYSNSGTVLHFLVRLPPFTQLFLEYQDASFDIPDRTFHSMATTYRLSSFASTTDVKELIPEFFFLPEFLCNLEGFDFGLRQCGIRVHHVTLPLWCREDPRLFVLIHRQALESDYVTSHLHKWVDLVFGYKQMGQAALDAVNVFHPATYFGMDISSVDEPVKRKALETMVKTYGQTPKMLFSSPHPARNMDGDNGGRGDASTSNPTKNSTGGLGDMLPTSILGSLRGSSDTKTYRRNKNSKVPRAIPQVKGLQWGDYVGSPSAPEPFIFLHKLMTGPIGNLVSLQTNDVCALAPKMSLLVVYTRDRKSSSSKPVDISWSALVTFDKPDNIIRLKLKHNTPGINLARFTSDNHVTCCVATPDCRSVIFGCRSGTIIAQRCNPVPEKGCDIELLPSNSLYCHTAEITCLSVCGQFRIFVSGSMDGTAAIWDLNSLSYVRSLTGHSAAVTSLAVSETSGDICTICDSGSNSGSHIRLWTINGSLVAAQDCRHRVRCVAFSNAPEGISVNVVAGGLENGAVRLWSSWDLTHVRDITSQSVHKPIVSVAFTNNSMVLYAATDGGLLVGWCRKDKEKEKQPLLITFLDAKTSPVT